MTLLTRYAFKVDYFDPQANMTRQYLFIYYTNDNTIEMFDMKTKRVFLKRCAYPSLTSRELFIGATINVFSRSLKLVDYGDGVTRQKFSAAMGELLILISDKGRNCVGTFIDKVIAKELRITNIRLVDLPDDVSSAYSISTRCFAVLIKGSDAEEKMSTVSLAFPGMCTVITNPIDVSTLSNILLCSGKTTAVMKNSSICVIKPHAITSGHQGAIVQRLIDEGFCISALGMYSLTVADAEDFLEVYNGVVPEYRRLVEQMSSGPSWAIEVCAENAVMSLRAICGPHDPEVCHALFPHTIRSLYGIDRTRNAVHCTDLEEDAPLESEFFFSLMQNL